MAMVGVDSGSLYRWTDSLSHLAWSWVGGCLALFYSVSQKKTGPLQLICHNFTNSQHSLIIFGTQRPYSILHSL